MIISEAIKRTYPWMFDIENDPKELWNIASANTWFGVAIDANSPMLAGCCGTGRRSRSVMVPGRSGLLGLLRGAVKD
jgi:hypothetical protein